MRHSPGPTTKQFTRRLRFSCDLYGPSMSAEDELAAFQAEIAAVETAAAEEDTGDGTPEELEFEDDDGTWPVWDRATLLQAQGGRDGRARCRPAADVERRRHGVPGRRRGHPLPNDAKAIAAAKQGDDDDEPGAEPKDPDGAEKMSGWPSMPSRRRRSDAQSARRPDERTPTAMYPLVRS